MVTVSPVEHGKVWVTQPRCETSVTVISVLFKGFESGVEFRNDVGKVELIREGEGTCSMKGMVG